jgi:hypothetical protein
MIREIQIDIHRKSLYACIYIYIADVTEWSSALDIRLTNWHRSVSMFKSHRGKNKLFSAQRSNSNSVGFNFQTYIYMQISTFTVILIIISLFNDRTLQI